MYIQHPPSIFRNLLKTFKVVDYYKATLQSLNNQEAKGNLGDSTTKYWKSLISMKISYYSAITKVRVNQELLTLLTVLTSTVCGSRKIGEVQHAICRVVALTVVTNYLVFFLGHKTVLSCSVISNRTLLVLFAPRSRWMWKQYKRGFFTVISR